MNAKPRGRQFFNNPGPTNIPDRVLRAMDRPVLDFMSDEFLAIQHACHAGVKRVLKTDQTLYMYNASGHGAWEAALANLFSAGDTVLIVETGYFSLELGGDGGQSRHQGRDLRRRLAQGRRHHQARRASGQGQGARDQGRAHRPQRDRDRHGPAGGRHPPRAWTRPSTPPCCCPTPSPRSPRMEYKMDAWGVDVTVGGSQKGLMLPTGMSLTGVSNKAIEVARKNKAPRHYWNWELMNGRAPQKFIGTAPVHMFFGLQESLKMIEEEGLDAVFQRHARLGEATRAAVRAWGAGGKGPHALRPDARPALRSR